MAVTENPFEMNPAELQVFLDEPRYMTCTTLKKDGEPVNVFLGFEWDGEALYFSIRNSRMITRRLKRHPRCWVAITNEYSPAKYVTMSGPVTVIEDPEWERTLRMFYKYMSPENDYQTEKDIDLKPFLDGYFDVGRTVYRMVPDKIFSEDGSKWEPGAAGISDARAAEITPD